MKNLPAFTAICALVTLLAACGKSAEPTAEAPAAAAIAVTAAVPAEAQSASASPSGVSGEPVDVCALLPEAEALAVIGKPYKPAEAMPAQGSLLGQCNYMGEKLMLMLSARPASEYRASADYAAKKGEANPVEGLGAEATMTPLGLMIQPAGKPYFVLVYALAGGQFDADSTLAIGKKLQL